jgi:hypothetical protein
VQGVRTFALVASFVAATACHVGETGTPVDGSVGIDGANASGVVLTWSSKPGEIPADIGDKLHISSVKFRVDNLRVIGDAGDTQTTRNDFTLDWKDGDEPDDIEFANAPTGLYSRVAIQADGHLVDYSWEIKGDVTLPNGDVDFEIKDRDALNVSLPINEMLQPGHSLAIKLEVDFTNPLNSVDYAALSKDDGVLELDTNDAQMPAFRAKLLQSIKVASSGTM